MIKSNTDNDKVEEIKHILKETLSEKEEAFKRMFRIFIENGHLSGDEIGKFLEND